MSPLFTVIVIILAVLAIIDLIVGVSFYNRIDS